MPETLSQTLWGITMAAFPRITICPAMPAAGAYYADRLFIQPKLPVPAAEKDAGGEYKNALAFSDYTRCQTSTKCGPRARMIPTPSWVLNATTRRAVILAYLVKRCFGPKQCAGISALPERARLAAVVARMKVQAMALMKVADGLCLDYVTTPDPARRKVLERAIPNIDAQICMTKNPEVFSAVLYDYYLLGLDSVGCAQRNGLTPVGVRQLISRMNRTARDRGFEVAKRKPGVKLSAEEKERRAAEYDRCSAERAAALSKYPSPT
ncbi:MAG: hypothetical protein WB566_05690 [Terriglobales bacterium]